MSGRKAGTSLSRVSHQGSFEDGRVRSLKRNIAVSGWPRTVSHGGHFSWSSESLPAGFYSKAITSGRRNRELARVIL